MRKFTNYMILQEFGLILECCKGLASFKDAIKMKQDELEDKSYNPDYNIIVDFQEFETNIKDKSMPESISSFFNFLKLINIKGKVAFLTAEPNQVVVSIILKELSAGLDSINIEIFTTTSSAIRYLGIPIENLDLISDKIKELNYNTA